MGASPGQPGAPVETLRLHQASSFPRLMHPGKAPDPSLGTQKRSLLQPRCGSGTKEPHITSPLGHLPTRRQDGTVRAPSFSHLPSTKGRGWATSSLLLLKKAARPWDSSFPQVASVQMPIYSPRSPPQAFPAGGLGLRWTLTPEMTWEDASLVT